jgi:hypothetical protein
MPAVRRNMEPRARSKRPKPSGATSRNMVTPMIESAAVGGTRGSSRAADMHECRPPTGKCQAKANRKSGTERGYCSLDHGTAVTADTGIKYLLVIFI